MATVRTVTGTNLDDELNLMTENLSLDVSGLGGHDLILGGRADDTLKGGTGDDTLNGGLGNDVLDGGLGNDLMLGGAGNDSLNGSDGDDVLVGEAGNDRLVGGNGDDNLVGGSGDDNLNGGFGADFLDGGDGADTVNAGAGDDVIVGGGGHDNLVGGDGHDQIAGGVGNDSLAGGVGNDSLQGGDNNDRLSGDVGNDVLEGGSGVDSLYGGDGDDVLQGGAGNDQLQSGAGNDRYVWGVGDTGTDTLADFDVAHDSVDLRGLAATPGASFVSRVDHLGRTTLNFDADGNGTTDISLKFNSIVNMTKADFAYLNDAPVTDGEQDVAVVEDQAAAATGQIEFTDADFHDVHSFSGSATGTHGAFVVDAATGAYTYTLNSTNLQYLAVGETVDETFTVTVTDDLGLSATQDVVVTITGTNDAPTVTAFTNGTADATGTGVVQRVDPDAPPAEISTTVSVSFDDVDTTDLLTYSVDAATSNTLGGTLTLLASDDSGTTGTAGSVSYTYSVANSAAAYLAAGETVTETFTITADDGNGGEVSQDVTVTITGANDAPTVVASSNGSLTEDTALVVDPASLDPTATADTLSTTVSVDFSDADLSDLLTYSYTAASGNTLGGTLTLLTSDDSGTDADGAVSYTYTLANSAAQYLAEGETATETFTITASDGQGGTVSQDVTVTITGTNDEAVITGTDTGSVVEAGGVDNATSNTPTATGTLTVTDPDTSDNSFTAVSTDTTSVSGYGSFTITAEGVWTYTLDNTHADVQALNIDGMNTSLTDTFVVTSLDGTEHTVTIEISGRNDAPVIAAIADIVYTDTAAADTFDEVSGTLDATDVDGEIVGFGIMDSDTTEPGFNKVVSDYGVLRLNTFTGDYTFTPDSEAIEALNGVPASVSFDVTFTAFDGTLAGTTPLTITLNGANDAPEAVDDSNTATEDAALVMGSVATNDSDRDANAVLTYSAAEEQDAVAGLTFNSDGSYSFDAADTAYQSLAEGETLEVTFDYTVTDELGASSDATLTLTLTGTNDAPTVTAFTDGSLTEDTGLVVDPASLDPMATADTLSTTVSVDFSDVDTTDVLTYSVKPGLDNTLSGTLTLLASDDTGTGGSTGSVSYTYSIANSAVQYLAAGETVTETYTITADDGQGGEVSQKVSITITGANDAPTVTASTDGTATAAAQDSVPAPSDITTTVEVSFNDVDTTDLLSYSVDAATTNTLGGTLTVLDSDDSSTTGNAGSVRYTYSVANSAAAYLAAGETVTETFTITADDGNSGTVSEEVTVTITGTNDAPTVTAVTNGSLTEDTDLVIDPASMDPMATADTLSTTVSVDFSDVDLSDTLSYSVAASMSNTLGGTLTLLDSNDTGTGSAGAVSYTYSVANSAVQALGAGKTLTETYTVTANDGQGGTVSQDITITITGTNDEAVITGTTTGAVVEAGGANNAIAGTPSASGTLSVTDVDTGESVFEAVSTATLSSNGYGSYTITEDGEWSYTLNNSNATVQALNTTAPGNSLTDTFVVKSADGTEETVTITISGRNDAPTIAAISPITITDTGADDTFTTITGQVNATDVDSGRVVYGIVGGSTAEAGFNTVTNDYGTIRLNTVTGAYTITQNDAAIEALKASGVVNIAVNFSATDGRLTDTEVLNITINGANEAPNGADKTLTTDEDTPITLKTSDFGFSESTRETADTFLAVKISTLPTAGTLLLDGVAVTAGQSVSVTDITANKLTFAPALNANGTGYASFTFQVQDNGGTPGTDLDPVANTLTFNVTAVNDAPVATAPKDVLYTDTSANDTFVASSSTFEASDVDNATLSYAASRSVVTDMGTVTTNATTGSFTIGTESYDRSLSGSYGTLYLNSGNGKYVYVPDDTAIEALKANATDSFSLTVSDGSLSDTETLNVKITATNDAPTLTAPTAISYADTAFGDTFTNSAATLAASDRDGDTLSYAASRSVVTDLGTVTTNSTTGSFTIGTETYDRSLAGNYGTLYLNSGNGKYVYVPEDAAIEALKANAQDSFTVTASDGDLDHSQTLNVNITAVNDAPVVTSFKATETGVTVLATDAESDPLTLALVNNRVPSGVINGTPTTTDTEQSFSITPTVQDGGIAATSIGVNDGSLNSNFVGLLLEGTDVTNGVSAASANIKLAFYGFGGNDVAVTGSGNDSLFGGEGNDTLSSGAGADLLVGGNGNDSLTGGAGNDVLSGGAGVDTATYNLSTDGSDEINLGVETVSSATQNDVVKLGFPVLQITEIRVTFTSANVGNGTGTGTTVDGSLSGAEASARNTVTLQLEQGGEPVGSIGYTDDEGITFEADQGFRFDVRDAVSGAERGNQFNKVVLGTSGNDTYDFGPLTAPPTGPIGTDYYINAGGGDDTVTGTEGSDFLVGGSGNDLLSGGDGNDSYIGGTGNDTIIGGGLGGSDTGVDMVVSYNLATDGSDEINLGPEFGLTSASALDVVNVSHQEQIQVVLNAANVGNSIGTGTEQDLLHDAADRNTVTLRGLSGLIGGTGYVDDEGVLLVVNGTRFVVNDAVTGHINDFLNGTGVNRIALGTSGNDTLHITTNTSAYVVGGAGNDTLTVTSSGNSLIEGGAGDDTITGSGRSDLLDGGTGNDTFSNIDGGASVLGGDGTDTLIISTTNGFSPSGDNQLTGVETVRAVTGNANVNISLFSQTEALSIIGNDGNNILSGSNTAGDSIDGGAGDDLLLSYGGNDTLLGGLGVDTLDGGSGNDVFVYTAAADFVSPGGPVIDSIVGGDGTDTIRIDANDFTIGSFQDVNAGSFARVNGVEVLAAGVAASGNIIISLPSNAYTAGIRTIDLSADTNSAGSNAINASRQTDPNVALTLIGSAGNDQFFIAGNTLFASATGGLVHSITGGAGENSLELVGSDAVQFTADNSWAHMSGVSSLRLSSASADGHSWVFNADAFTAGLSNISLQNDTNAAGTNILDASRNATSYVFMFLTGSSGADVITGGARADFIFGREGADSLIGGTGRDVYELGLNDNAIDTVVENGSAVLVSNTKILNFDIVNQFVAGQDVLNFNNGMGRQLAGTFGVGDFTLGTAATDNDVIVFNDTNGNNTLDAGELAVVLRGVGAAGGAVDLNGAADGNGYGEPADTSMSQVQATETGFTISGLPANSPVKAVYIAEYDLAPVNGAGLFSYALANNMPETEGLLSPDSSAAGAFQVDGGQRVYLYQGLDTADNIFLASKLQDFSGTGITQTNTNGIIYGQGGNDNLSGAGGNDYLFGGIDNDTLTGADGADTLSGGSGNDVFRFEALDSLYVSDAELGDKADTISDFSAGDSISFGSVAGQASNFQRTSALAGETFVDIADLANLAFDDQGAGATYAYVYYNGGDGYLFYDANGNGNLDMNGTDQVVLLVGAGGNFGAANIISDPFAN